MRGYVLMLGILAASWGASYLFIKVAVEDLEPAPMMCLRLILAFAALFPVLAYASGFAERSPRSAAPARGGALLGLINMAIPFTLIAWGEKHVDSGVAAIANSTVPIFVALLAIRFRPSERVTGMRLFGVLLGLLGVGVLTGLNPEGGWWAIAGTLAVVVASFSYACANLYAPARFGSTEPIVVAAATTFWGMILLIPLSLFQLPDQMPGWKALASVAALGLIGTAFATLILYRMLNTYGVVAHVARHVPAAADGALLRRHDPRRADPPERGARPPAHPRGRGARLGRLQGRAGPSGRTRPGDPTRLDGLSRLSGR